MIELRVLGALDLRGPDGEEILSVLAQPMRTALLAYLALARPRGYQRRDTLTSLFWPDSDQKHARASLRQALYYLSRSLGGELLTKRGQEEIALDPEEVWCDAAAFEDALDAAELEEALELYRGDLMDGFFLSGCPEFERWLEVERERLRERAAGAAWTLAHREVEEGRITSGERLGQRALGWAGTDEHEVRRFMAALAGAGDRAAAVRFYERFAEELEEALELEPSAETRALVERIREGEERSATGGTGSGESVGEDGPAPSQVEAPGAPPVSDPGPAKRSAGVSRPRLAWMGLVVALVAVAALALWRPWRGPVEPVEPPEAGTPPIDGPALAVPDDDRPRVAILPLENLSADEIAYLAAGLHEELLRRLSLVRSLAVISRTSVLRYAETDAGVREIAADLGVRYIVEGTVQEDGGRVRIHVQLIDAAEDRHLWANRYDRASDDLFALQSAIAEDIAGELEVLITPEERARIDAPPTDDPIAYDLYLRAVELGYEAKEEYDASVQLLRRATELDPGFALAHARLALTFAWGRGIHGYPTRDSAVARGQLAVRSDPLLPEAHVAVSRPLAHWGRYQEATASAHRALTLNPNLGRAWWSLAAAELSAGDPVASAFAGRRGLEVDPGSPELSLHLAYALAFAGMFTEAGLWYERVLALQGRPRPAPVPHRVVPLFFLTINSIAVGDLETARAYATEARRAGADASATLYVWALVQLFTGDAEGAESALRAVVLSPPDVGFRATPSAEALLAWASARIGRPEARQALETLRRERLQAPESSRRSVDLTVIASALGEEEEQLRWFLDLVRLEEIRTDEVTITYHLRSAPWLDGIREGPAFQEWLTGMEDFRARLRERLEAFGEWTPEAMVGTRGG